MPFIMSVFTSRVACSYFAGKAYLLAPDSMVFCIIGADCQCAWKTCFGPCFQGALILQQTVEFLKISGGEYSNLSVNRRQYHVIQTDGPHSYS